MCVGASFESLRKEIGKKMRMDVKVGKSAKRNMMEYNEARLSEKEIKL